MAAHVYTIEDDMPCMCIQLKMIYGRACVYSCRVTEIGSYMVYDVTSASYVI